MVADRTNSTFEKMKRADLMLEISAIKFNSSPIQKLRFGGYFQVLSP
jgi:hypothetical protein